MLRSCFLSSFVEFHSAVSEEKSKMSQPIRRQGGHLVFPIGPKYTNLGCSSVILLRLKMGVAPHKQDVISMPTQQCTNTKHISIERYQPVVSIMLRYLDQIKTFGENLCCRAVKIDKIFWGDLPYFALKCDNFPKGFRKKAECPNEAYFLAKKI